ncbi:MAG TPA: hypothetical protein VGR50_08075 [Terriglobales bacterium]|nr:hypothetical protein [Terriglobales bacterium]
MKQLQEMLKQKEHELGRLQKEIEALRLVVDLCAEGHSKVTDTGEGRRFAAASAAAASVAANGGTMPAVAMSAAPGNGGAKRFP